MPSNPELVRKTWPTERMGPAPSSMICGVPAHVDGRMLAISEGAGASIVNRDRMWHYVEGVRNWDPIWPDHAIRIIPGPSSLWLDVTAKDVKLMLSRVRKGPAGPVAAFMERGVDFVVRDELPALVEGMNAVAPEPGLAYEQVEREVLARDRELANRYSKDMQIMAIRSARTYLNDRVMRVAKPHRLLDPAHGPLIAVRLHLLTRKTLGGLETNLDSQVIRPDGEPIAGLYAAGEVAGFGSGGVHGHNALEGTFLGGCIFSGRAAGRALAQAVA